jgi:hypothetical protein
MARLRGGRIRETFFFFNTLDILNRSFRPRIKLDGVVWLLLEITSYNPLAISSTKVVLQYEQAQTSEDITNFSFSPVTGFLTTEGL